MGFRRKFNGEPVARLIVSVPVERIEEIDELIGYRPGQNLHGPEWLYDFQNRNR